MAPVRWDGRDSEQLLEQLMRGHLSPEEVGAFARDLDSAEFLETIAQIGSTTLAALTHNVTGVSLDEAFRPRAWSTPTRGETN